MSVQSSRLRRATGLVAVPGLALALLTAVPSAPTHAAEPDPAPVAAGAAWLESQLTDGLIVNTAFGDPFNDYGLSIDTALALQAVGGHTETVEEVSAAVSEDIGSYVGDGTTESYAGSLAKAAVLADAAGDDPTSFGGVDLIGRLEARVSDTGATLGRIQDASEFGDFANTFGQTFAVRALDESGSTEAEAATEFLVAQQCTGEDEGFFRQDFAAIDAPGQACDDAESPEPSTDATALAVLALLPQADDTDVQAAIDAAVTWLVEEQAGNGSFGSGADIPAPNSNSTGLAGWALGEAGETDAAERAAAYVRAFQVDESAPCSTALSDSEGAIAYDGPALTAGRKDGITVALEDQWRRASAQALPALRWAPAEPIDPPSISDPPHRYFRPGERVTLHADVQTPGDTVCFFLGQRLRTLAPVRTDGSATLSTRLPDGTATRTYRFSTDEVEKEIVARYRVLDATKLRLELRREVARGGTQVVKIRGLAEGERFRAILRGKRVDAGRANDKGRAVARFGVGRTTGPVRVLVLGEFTNRRASRAFTVTR
jgi:hypothetical protein